MLDGMPVSGACCELLASGESQVLTYPLNQSALRESLRLVKFSGLWQFLSREDLVQSCSSLSLKLIRFSENTKMTRTQSRHSCSLQTLVLGDKCFSGDPKSDDAATVR